MKMIDVLGAFLLGGATGFVAKDKLFDNKKQQTSRQNELDDLYAENEKFSKRNRELERQVDLYHDTRKTGLTEVTHNG